MTRKFVAIVLCLLFFLVMMSCAPSASVSVQVLKPASIHLPGIKKIAIADLLGPQRSGSQIATLTQSKLMQSQHFEIVERDKLKRVLEEQKKQQAAAKNFL